MPPIRFHLVLNVSWSSSALSSSLEFIQILSLRPTCSWILIDSWIIPSNLPSLQSNKGWNWYSSLRKIKNNDSSYQENSPQNDLSCFWLRVNLKGSSSILPSNKKYQSTPSPRRTWCRVWGKFKSIATTNEMESLCTYSWCHSIPFPPAVLAHLFLFILGCHRLTTHSLSLSPSPSAVCDGWLHDASAIQGKDEQVAVEEVNWRVLWGVELFWGSYLGLVSVTMTGWMDGWQKQGHNDDDAQQWAERRWRCRARKWRKGGLAHIRAPPKREYSN